MVLSSEQLAIFVPAAFLVAVSPGANNILSLSHGALAGFPSTVLSLSGRVMAFGLMLLVVAAGLGAVFERSYTAFIVLKWFGVCYLAYIGFSMWARKEKYLAGADTNVSRLQLAKKEFFVAITNPKAVLLFTAFLPQFVVQGQSYFHQLIILGCLYILIEFAAACFYAACGSLFQFAIPSASKDRLICRIGGSMMLAAAGMLALIRRTPA